MPAMRPYGKPKGLMDDEIEEVNMDDGSKGHKAKGGGFTFKGEGSKEKAIEQARKMKKAKK